MDSTLACLAPWMARQRWYAAKGSRPSLAHVARWVLPSPDPTARVIVHLVADESSLPAVVYQVPVVERETADADPPREHVIGTPVPGTTLVDGPFDPAFTATLEMLVTHGGRGGGVVGRPLSDPPPAEHRAASVLTGEQSNTSIVYRGAERSLICKVFRQVHPGLSPDIELSGALSDALSPYVPRAVGALAGTWSKDGAAVTGSLAFAQEFLADVEDEWRVALRSAAEDRDFTAEAAALGTATAEVHDTLAELFPTRAPTADDVAATTRAWTRRLATAGAEVATIADLADAVSQVYEAAQRQQWPDLQRIHGDLHLGQVLHVPGRGCVLLDFEGEPLRPMGERMQPDLALRDVAGVLRSFDYVAGSLRTDRSHTSEAAQTWARRARRSFLDAYAAASRTPRPESTLLLVALELDKAVYECIYEARNRPDWLGIPLAGVRRLLARADASV